MATTPRIVVSIPIHENLPVIRDQIANIQQFLPHASIVLHINQDFKFGSERQFWGRWGSPALVDRWVIPTLRAIPGVFVNDVRMETRWGNILHTHLSNFHFAEQTLEFESFVLLSSACLLTRPGAEETIGMTDFGIAARRPSPDWRWFEVNVSDPVFQAIRQDCGAPDLFSGQSEGTYYRRDLFAEMTAIIERHWRYDRDHIRCHEEVYLPTISTTLAGKNSDCPLIVRDKDLRVEGADAVNVIRDASWMDHLNPQLESRRKRLTVLSHDRYGFGLRPVPRVMKDPTRRYIRSLTS